MIFIRLKFNNSYKLNKYIIITLFLIVILFLSLTVYNNYCENNCKDINYAIKKYTTKGLFNKYKLFKLESSTIEFMDNRIAIVKVTGIIDKAPYNIIEYKLELQLNKNGIWKVVQYYLP